MTFLLASSQREWDALRALIGKRLLTFDGQVMDAENVYYDNVEVSFYVDGRDAFTGKKALHMATNPPNYGVVDIASPDLPHIIAEWTAKRAQYNMPAIAYGRIVDSLLEVPAG